MPENFFTDFTSDGEALPGSSAVEKKLKKSSSDKKEINLNSDPTPVIVSIQQKRNFNLLSCFPKIVALFSKGPKSVEVSSISSEPLTVAEELIERARGTDLSKVSPLGALQLGIERINFEAKDAASFKGSLSRRLFAKNGMSRDQVDKLWEQSLERKAIFEIYAMIDLAKDVGRPITFRDAFNRVYESRKPEDRSALDRIAKVLICGR